MTPQLLLEKIIEKAMKNGWVSPKSYTNYEATDDGKYWRASFDDYYNVEAILFDHLFAKAYFGEEMILRDDVPEELGKHFQVSWTYHIEALALTPPEERLSYLSKYL